MKIARIARTVTLSAVAASLVAAFAGPATAAMTPEQEQIVTARLVEMAAFVDGYTAEHGQLPSEQTFTDAFPDKGKPVFAYEYSTPQAKSGFCLSASRIAGWVEPEVDLKDLRMYDSVLNTVMIPTAALINGKDLSTTPCATVARESYVTAYRYLLRSDLRNASLGIEIMMTENPAARPTIKQLAKHGLFRPLKGNHLSVKYGKQPYSYCLRATNPKADLGAGEFFWYDSTAGGLLPESTRPGKDSLCARKFPSHRQSVRNSLKQDVRRLATWVETLQADDPDGPAPTMEDLAAKRVVPTKGNIVELRYAKSSGYCLRAANPDAALPADQFVWYDGNGTGLSVGAKPTTAGSYCAEVF